MKKLPLLAIAATVLVASAAQADDLSSCVAAAERGQVLKNERRIKDARAEFSLCTRDACPAEVRADCASWFAKVELDLASIVIRPRDVGGTPLANVRVTIDAQPAAADVPIELDPGLHTVRVDAADHTMFEQALRLEPGDRNHSVTPTLAREVKPAATTVVAPARPSRVGPLIVGGAGVVALGIFGFFALSASSQRSDLQDECKGRCPDSRLDPVRDKLVVADVALGAGVTALAAAALWWLMQRPSAER